MFPNVGYSLFIIAIATLPLLACGQSEAPPLNVRTAIAQTKTAPASSQTAPKVNIEELNIDWRALEEFFSVEGPRVENLRGYTVVTASDGKSALNLAAEVEPDLIVLDVMMPGLDGFETCRRLKADSATVGIPVVFISSKSETEDIIEGFRLGGVDYITKPFRQEELLARIETQLKIARLTKLLSQQNAELQADNGQLQREVRKRGSRRH